ncbi:MAG: tripartite tricarboxylate transporter substrate binding protein [Acetobacteraceae bacterium]|nr:tripartite tricarboxylate transporter substrate binding protein [Acetobacteraceae bacterium]MSP30973.1 tripartite tricarboxylate transporter substrate binding protein [Acetobacteraceae bacterium]
MRRRQILQLGTAAAVTAPLARPQIANAQAAWPNKPVRVLVPFAAGGGTDVIARPWADMLGRAFGQQFVVENRGGASGIIGTEAVVRSAGDGYTLLVSSNTTTVNLPLLRKVPYDPAQLEPIARLGDVVTGFTIHPSVGAKTFKEMLDYAKQNPGKLSFGSSGPGTGPHMRLEMLKLRTKADILHVPYRGGADALIDMLAGHVLMMNEPVTNPHVKAGKLHMLCTNHSERNPDFPEIPTLTELGYPNSDAPIWMSLWCPAGTPKEIKVRLNEEIVKQSKTPEMREKLRLAGAAPVVQTMAELEAFRAADIKQMAELIKIANIKIE